jgi:diguanylate cyclase (GGDEF)-like protein
MALEDIAGTHREEQILYDLAQSLGSRLDIADAMMLIGDKVSRLVPFVSCALFLGDEGKGYVCRYAHGPGAEALLRRTATSSSDIALRLPSCADGRDAGGGEIAAVLPCPLIVEGRTIGVLVLYHTIPGFFTDDHRRVLGRISEQAASVIINSTRFEQSRHESQTDPLTALPNRRSLAEQFEAGLARTQRTGGSIALIVLDLDRLKEINDTFGHEAGDLAIRTVASALRSSVRTYDLCARFAGDEFVVVLWDCEAGHELHRMREFQTAVATRSFEPHPGIRVALSISAGMARLGQDGDTFQELLAVADTRMYQDKADRRSRGTQRSSSVANLVGDTA